MTTFRLENPGEQRLAEQRARITSWDENSSGPTDGTKTPRRHSSARGTTGGRENMLAFSFLFLAGSHHSKTRVARSH